MNNTPESNKAKIAFTSLFANDDAYWIPYTVGMKFERERDEAREQRDRLAVACRLLMAIVGPLEKNTWATDNQIDRAYNAGKQALATNQPKP
jgi:hypothetical protein